VPGKGWFLGLLFFTLRATTERESFRAAAIQSQLESNRELNALTLLLAEVASLAKPVVLILDDMRRAPQAALRDLVACLLNNAPPNLQFVIGSRRPLELELTDLVAGGRLAARMHCGETESVVADLRSTVYARVIRMEDPAFLEVTRIGKVLSRLTTDTTLVQSITGVNLSIMLRSTISLAVSRRRRASLSPRCRGSTL